MQSEQDTKYFRGLSRIIIIAAIGTALSLVGAGIYAFRTMNCTQETSPNPSPLLSPTPIIDVTAGWETYRNEEYGFEMALPNSWKGYSILEESWDGITLDGTAREYHGPQIAVRNQKWTQDQPWQDIPIMVFTLEEWELVENENLTVSAAPIGPSRIGGNQNYVFALPPRWVGFTDALGMDEAIQIVETFTAY